MSLNKRYGNLPQNVKNIIKSKYNNISLLTKENVINYLKNLTKAELMKSLNIGTIQSIVKKEKRKKYFEKLYNDHKFENIIRNKANMYSYEKVKSNPKKLNGLSKAIGKRLYYNNEALGRNPKTEKQWINAVKNALLKDDAILNKTLNLGQWLDNNSDYRATLNSMSNNEWKKNIGNELSRRTANYIYKHRKYI